MKRLASAVTQFLTSEHFFYIVIGIFVLQAVWFAVTARYPMAFDEDFHFGLIKLHANQWLPYFAQQPPGANVYGAVVRDPSYLYHFLLSIPYRAIQLVTNNQTAQVIVLRLLNIAMFTYSFVLVRRLLVHLGGSRPLNHVVLLLFSLVPIVPFLAAHINYDNLFFLLTLWVFLGLFTWIDQLKHQHVSFARTSVLVSIMMLTSLVKYTFLPVAAAVGAIMLWQLWEQRSHRHAIWNNFVGSIRRLTQLQLAALLLFILIASGLFAERYAINLIRYHVPSPDCAQVLSVASCRQYGPWERDYEYIHTGYIGNRLDYPWQWLYGMWQRSFFAISDTYDTKAPLPLPGDTTIALAVIGCILFLWYSPRILRNNTYRQIMIVAIGFYVSALFIQTYQSFVKTGIPVAINGRYLVPFLPFIFLFVGLAFRRLWHMQQSTKVLATVIVTLLFLQGGGVITFIVKSNDTWDWPNDAVIRVNHTARNVLQAVVVGAKN